MKKSQGEIFGVALLFVVILVGVLVFAKFQSISNLNSDNQQQEGEYQILAEGTLNTLLKVSTGCRVERDKDSIRDLMNYCLENEFGQTPRIDSEIECEDGSEYRSCQHVKDLLNRSLYLLFNSTQGIGEIPFELSIDIPANRNSLLYNTTITNFGDVNFRGAQINETSRRNLGYKRSSSGLISWRSAQKDVELELYLYYR